MSDDLKKIYIGAGLADRFWDAATPVDLWRAQKNTDYRGGVMVLEPHRGSETRAADVKIVERDGNQFVLGCRCVYGKDDFRGVSTFDMKVTWFGSKTTKHFRIPASTDIPAGLAVTKDYKNAEGAHHYTIAPKDDMTLGLFLQNLKALSAKATLEI